jgi:hypothetical protein
MKRTPQSKRGEQMKRTNNRREKREVNVIIKIDVGVFLLVRLFFFFPFIHPKPKHQSGK